MKLKNKRGHQVNKNAYEEVKEYLENVKSGAKAMDDV